MVNLFDIYPSRDNEEVFTLTKINKRNPKTPQPKTTMKKHNPNTNSKQPFSTECTIVAADDSFVENIKYAESAEVKPIFIDTESDDCELLCEDKDANSFGVYLRYSGEFVKNFNFNPSEWIADFANRQSAEYLANILNALIKN